MEAGGRVPGDAEMTMQMTIVAVILMAFTQ
jgi:hypothetical protein